MNPRNILILEFLPENPICHLVFFFLFTAGGRRRSQGVQLAIHKAADQRRFTRTSALRLFHCREHHVRARESGTCPDGRHCIRCEEGQYS
jgi:hypothetical protein